MGNAVVAGVGMVKFAAPGKNEPYRVMAAQAIRAALKDAGLDYAKIQQAYAGYVYGDSTCGQHALYDVGQTGIPVVNVNNNCSSGSSALFLARQAIQSGALDCVLAFGFEEMKPGALGSVWSDREDPLGRGGVVLDEFGFAPAPVALRSFGAASEYYLEQYDAKPLLFAQVGVKTRQHATRNPYALFNQPITTEDVLSAKLIYGHSLTRYMACPPTCGAGAAILCSERFAREHGLTQGVKIIGQAMATDVPQSWTNPISVVGAEITRLAAAQAFAQAGVGPADVDVIELHDCFTPNEVFTYEALGLCAEGGATKLVADGDNTYGGQWVVNPSGGLMSKGHPLGATGLAQCAELVWQLRGEAGARQVPDARIALQHNIGLGGAAVVTVYQRA
ncbi:MAG: lipid-transfer protein [Nevskia sp.]